MTESQSGVPTFLRGLFQLIKGLLQMALGLIMMLVSLAGLFMLIGTPIAILIAGFFDIPVQGIPIIGGVAALGVYIHNFLWELSEIIANLFIIVLAIVLGYAFFTGQLDEWIESIDQSSPRDTNAEQGKSKNAAEIKKDTNRSTTDTSKPRRKKRL